MLLLCALVVGSGSAWAVTDRDVFTRISSQDELSDGDEIIFVNQAETHACGTTQNTNNRTTVSISVSDHSYTYASSDNVQVFVVKTNSNGQFGFHTGSGYIYSAASDNNYLKTNTTAASTAPSGTEAWTLTIGNSIASAKNVTNTSYYLAFNGTTDFSQYKSQTKPYIYKKANVWESTSKGIDVLTYSTFFNPSEGGNEASYTNFTNKKGTSQAIYSGMAAKQKDINYIQIRSTNSNSGIVTTTSGGKVRKIEVTWHSNTNAGNKIDIYGKNSVYSSASDLYNSSSSKYGTKLGSITKGTNTKLSISGDYKYIGIRSNNGVCYLSDITIYWEGDAVSLSDASNYTPSAKDYAKVRLDREFVEGWNGIILPFDLTTDVKTAFDATEVKTLGSATEDGGAITLNFTDASLPVAAGTPVLVKLNSAMERNEVVVNGAEIKTTVPTTVVKSVAGNTFTLTGTYGETDLEDSEAYFVSNDKFYHKAAGVALTAAPFRAYIVQTATSGTRMSVNFNMDGTESSGVASINREPTTNSHYYDLQGRRVASAETNSSLFTIQSSLKKGLYIVNGKKVVIK